MAMTPLVATLLRKDATELGSRKRSVAMVKPMKMAIKPMMAPALGDFANSARMNLPGVKATARRSSSDCSSTWRTMR